MANFPGPEKNKMEAFIYHLYEGKEGTRLSKQEIVSRAYAGHLATDVQVFFEEIPDGNYTEDRLIEALNHVITRRGREHAIGGTLKRLHSIPPNWQDAYQQTYGS
jgi:hypothetical protein